MPCLIDGSQGEGGGQIIRTALTLSLLTDREVRIENIRARRRNPGLAPQHLTNVRALAELCGADLAGDQLGSTRLQFKPQRWPRSGGYRFDVAQTAGRGSAGSVTLILQTLLLPLISTEQGARLHLTGGTHVPWSPSAHYISQVYLKILRQLGIVSEMTIRHPGFYPRGGGKIDLAVEPVGVSTINGVPRYHFSSLDCCKQPQLTAVRGTALVCQLSHSIGLRMARQAEKDLLTAGIPADIKVVELSGPGPGAALCLQAQFDGMFAGFDALGKKGLPAERVAEEATTALIEFISQDAPVDPYLADQLLLPLAMSNKPSRFRTAQVTSHFTTNAAVIEQMANTQIHVEHGIGSDALITIAPDLA